MLVKVKNVSTATRVFYQNGGGEIKLAPGSEATCDLPMKMVRAFEVEQETRKSVTIELIGPLDDEPPEPKRTFTLRPEEMDVLQQPMTIKEALGKGTAAPPKVPHETVEVDPALAQSMLKNPIAANAANNAEKQAALEGTDTKPPEVHEPKDAAELLAAIEAGTVSAEDQMRIARHVIKRQVPKGIKPTGLLKLLRTQTLEDAAHKAQHGG